MSHDPAQCAIRVAPFGPAGDAVWHAGTLMGPMRVEVHLHAELARLAPEQRGVVWLDVADGTRVGDVLRQFPLDSQQRIIVGVNGNSAQPEQVLFEGARIDLLTPMAGGSSARRHT